MFSNFSEFLGLKRATSVALAIGLLVGCTTKFPVALIDGGDPEDAQAQDAGPDTGAPDTGQPDVLVTDCGNGTIDAGEDCDDGNTNSGDGCDSTCQEEAGWICAGVPTVCDPVCGDGLVVGPEACDDNNAVSGDGCNDACEVDCANASTEDCNPPGETLDTAARFVDQAPPVGFVQCAGFENTNSNDVGPNWDANCLGVAMTLRIRYWDTSSIPWTLLGDATLTPDSDATYAEQIHSATNHGGTDGFLENQGLSMLKDDPAVTPVTTWVCNPGHPVREYAASDLYFGTQTDSDSVMVCGWSEGDDVASPCDDEDELLMASAGFGACALGGDTNDLAIAIYQQL